jgi:hypothetical protein
MLVLLWQIPLETSLHCSYHRLYASGRSDPKLVWEKAIRLAVKAEEGLCYEPVEQVSHSNRADPSLPVLVERGTSTGKHELLAWSSTLGDLLGIEHRELTKPLPIHGQLEEWLSPALDSGRCL